MQIEIHLLCVLNHDRFSSKSAAYYYGKKKSRRVGRPPGGHSNLEEEGKEEEEEERALRAQEEAFFSLVGQHARRVSAGNTHNAHTPTRVPKHTLMGTPGNPLHAR